MTWFKPQDVLKMLIYTPDVQLSKQCTFSPELVQVEEKIFMVGFVSLLKICTGLLFCQTVCDCGKFHPDS